MGLLWSTPAVALIRFAALLLLHAAYSGWEASGYAKAHGITIPRTLGSPLPVDILVQTLLSLALLVVGVAWRAAPLKDIAWSSEMATRSIDSESSSLSLLNVRHRGSLLFSES